MIRRASTTLVICALAAGIAVVGLGRSAADTSPVTAASAPAATNAAAPDDTNVVTIEGFAFGGTTVGRPGQTLTINNLDSAPHTVTARDGAFDSGTIQGGANAAITLPAEPGTYEFFCSIHPSMVSTITVQA